MRSLILICLAGAAACGDNTGLALTISAPEGPGSASRIELVLASHDTVTTVKGQLTGGEVRYYRQKSSAGAIEDLARLDGFVVRIEGQDGKGDEPFIPFVIAYDDRSQPIAVGTVLDPQGLPLALEVPNGSRLEATVSMIPLLPVDPEKGILSGQIAELGCTSEAGVPWRSGLAWQPPVGLQLRLLLTDPTDDTVPDASGRGLDLDCDGHSAFSGDCDDVRVRYNPDAGEACDGEDTNCDGAPFSVSRCSPPETECGPGSTEGVQVCRDLDQGTSVGTCVGSPACRCRLGNPGPCSKCILAFEGGEASAVKPCAPGLTKLQLPLPIGTCALGEPCTVQVVQHDGPWEVGVAADPLDGFDLRTEVDSNQVWLRVKSELSSLPALPGSSVGAIHLVISTGASQTPLYIGIDLELANLKLDDCASIVAPSGGVFTMACSVAL